MQFLQESMFSMQNLLNKLNYQITRTKFSG